jgi:translocation and assembly module TamA
MFKPHNILFFIGAILLTGSILSAAEPVEVRVEGLEGDALENVRTALALPYGLVQDGTVNTFWLERFNTQVPDKVRRALEPFGYYHAVIRTTLEKTGDNSYRVVVAVEPGEPVRIARVTVALHGAGSDEKRLKEIVNAFPLKNGDVLLQKKYEETKGALKFRAVELGYLDAEFSVHKIEIDPDKSLARLDLELETGRQYRFGDVRFEGAPRYPDRFLRRYLTFKPGDIFSYAKLGETQLNLVNSDRFKGVFPVPEKEKAQDDRVPILIKVQEAPAKRLRPGIGYATDIGPRLSTEYRDLNIFERGHEFHAEFNLSQRLQSLGARYILPDSKDINSFSGLQFNLKREDVTTYTNEVATAELDRTTSFRRGRLGTAYLKFDREDATIASERVRSRLVLPGVRFTERRYDNLLRPTGGHSYTIDITGTHQALGSNARFIQIVTEGNLLVPLPWRLSLYTRAKVGATFQNESVANLPVSYRLFAGGDRSVRGYAYQSLGPRNAAGAVTGGKDILVGSMELERALFKNWGVAAFYDAGNAFNSFTDIHLSQGAGAGVRYYTMIGALRLDVARQLAVEHPSYRIHFTVGFAF